MNDNTSHKKKIIISVCIILLLIIMFGTTIAYFRDSFSVSNTNTSKNYKTSVTHTFNAPASWKPGDSVSANLSVTNEGNVSVGVRAKVEEKFVDSNGDTISGLSNEISPGFPVVLKEQDKGWVRVGDYYYYNELLPSNGDKTTSVISSVTFNKLAGETSNYTTAQDGTISYNGCTQNQDGTATCNNTSGYASVTDDDVNYKIDVTFEILQSSAISTEWSGISYDSNGKINKTTLYDKVAEGAVDDTAVNFGQTSVANNTNGKYKLTKIVTTEPIYYYRGNVTNNNVYFGGYCWKIIRTTSTGGVKMIYNGTGSSSSCTGTNPTIGESAYNTEYNDIKYAGYMYSNGVNENKTNSTIKTYIDNWYETNLKSSTKYIEDTPYYSERNVTSTGGSAVVTGLAPGERIWGFSNTNGAWGNATAYAQVANTTILLDAQNANDKFTVSSVLGNGALKYPVAMLTSDEAVMAGGRGRGYESTAETYGNNENYYLYTSYYQFTMSSFGYNNQVSIITITPNGELGILRADNAPNIRPVISLKNSNVVSGGNGTAASPYTIVS